MRVPSSTFALRAAARQVADELGFLELKDRYDGLTAAIVEAMSDHDPRLEAELRLERALVQLHLRDLWGPWSREYGRWDYWMRDDLAAAQRFADQLARKVGDRELWRRLLMPYPRLAGLVS